MTLEQMKSLDKEDFLGMLGLESKRGPADYVGPAIGVFALGMLVGASVGLLLAPRSGRELREDIARLPQKANDAVHHAAEAVQQRMHDGKILA